MKYDIERIALWVIVTILAIAVFFPRRGSGFMLNPNTDTNTISLMDLKEFSMVTPEKRNYYKTNVLNTSNLTSIASGTTTMGVIPMLDMWLMSSIRRPSPSVNIMSVVPPTTGASCTGVIIMGDCMASQQTCNPPLTTRTVGTSRYCICPTNEFIYVNPSTMMASCVSACPTNAPRIVTEQATGQRMCQAFCPPARPGYTCI